MNHVEAIIQSMTKKERINPLNFKSAAEEKELQQAVAHNSAS